MSVNLVTPEHSGLEHRRGWGVLKLALHLLTECEPEALSRMRKALSVARGV